jgi:arylsulfatase A-like enzyme
MSIKAIPVLLLISVLFVLQTGCRQGTDHPNIVFILVDDLGWYDLSCNGNPYFETPNMDDLARRGTVFSQAYSSPLCTPTRAALMTGKYPGRLKMTRVGSDYDRGKSDDLEWYHPATRQKPGDLWDELSVDVCVDLPFEETTIAEMAKQAGYRTGFVGKWHLGFDEYYPEHHGFDWVFGGDHWSDYFAPWIGHRTAVYEAEPGEHITTRVTREAVKFIEESGDKPFFLCLWNYAVHAPIEGRPDLVEYYDGKIPENEGFHPVYAAMVHTVDECVGSVVRCLEENGLTENTLIVFMSDNGPINGRGTEDIYDPRYFLNRNTANDELMLGGRNFELQQEFNLKQDTFLLGFTVGESGIKSGTESMNRALLKAEVYSAGPGSRKLASEVYSPDELIPLSRHYITVQDPEAAGSYLLKLQGVNGMGDAVIPFESTLNESIPGALLSVNGIREEGNLFLKCIPGTENLPRYSTLGSSGPFRGRKIMVYEGGVRVPLFFTWPGKIGEGNEIGTPVAHIDMLPTLSAFMGAEVGHEVDGLSLHDLIMNGNPIAARELHWHYPHYMYSNGAEAIRDERYKYIEFYNDGRKELYDLEMDPGERQNLLDQKPEVAEELKEKMDDWLEQINASMPSPLEK